MRASSHLSVDHRSVPLSPRRSPHRCPPRSHRVPESRVGFCIYRYFVDEGIRARFRVYKLSNLSLDYNYLVCLKQDKISCPQTTATAATGKVEPAYVFADSHFLHDLS